MFGARFQIMRLFGFPIHVDVSWFLIVLFITWSLATRAFPSYVPNQTAATYWAMGVAGALGLFASILLHELGHALAARRNDLPMKGITLFLFGGVAEMTQEPPNAKVEFIVAIAGPLVSIAIIVFCALTAAIGSELGAPAPMVAVVGYLAVINAVVVGFNLIPAFPLDGGRVLRSILWRAKGSLAWATRITSILGTGFGYFLIALGFGSIFIGDVIGGIWLGIIGLFLQSAAKMSYQQVLVRQALEGEVVGRFMRADVNTVSSKTTIAELVHDHLYRHHHKMYPVVDEGRLVGCVTVRDVQKTPQDEWDRHTVGEVASPCGEQTVIASNADAADALTKMSASGASRLMVVDDGDLKGVVTAKDLLGLISRKAELGIEPMLGSRSSTMESSRPIGRHADQEAA